jgi:hypothetical protein
MVQSAEACCSCAALSWFCGSVLTVLDLNVDVTLKNADFWVGAD